MQRRAPLLSVVVASRDELTTTEYAVLALLSYGERSGYDLARAAKRTMGPAWAPSRSQIYKVLPRLVGWDLAESREVEQRGRPDKALYRITERGIDVLRSWIEQVEEEPAGGINVFRLKLQFAGVASPEAAFAQLETYRRLVERRLGELEEMERNLAPDASVYSRVALRHGIIISRATLTWAGEAHAALQAAHADALRRERKPL
jgi:PadR family transcriptional regulator, regulatory protein AphA